MKVDMSIYVFLILKQKNSNGDFHYLCIFNSRVYIYVFLHMPFHQVKIDYVQE